MALKAVARDMRYDATLGESLVSREATMSDKLSSVKAELLLDQLNRRSRLLGIIQNTTSPRWWFWSLPGVLLVVLLFGTLEWLLAREETFSSAILPLAVCSLVGIVDGIVTLHKRVDALVELLREEGILRDTPPVARLLGKQ
jgi:hypothetical protein